MLWLWLAVVGREGGVRGFTTLTIAVVMWGGGARAFTTLTMEPTLTQPQDKVVECGVPLVFLTLQAYISLYPNSEVVNLVDTNTSSLYNSDTLWLVQFYSHWSVFSKLIHSLNLNLNLNININLNSISTSTLISTSN